MAVDIERDFVAAVALAVRIAVAVPAVVNIAVSRSVSIVPVAARCYRRPHDGAVLGGQRREDRFKLGAARRQLDQAGNGPRTSRIAATNFNITIVRMDGTRSFLIEVGGCAQQDF